MGTMEKRSDEYYIREILRGDSGSFSYLVDKYSQMAFSLSMKVLHHREDAEEAAQDSFMKAFHSLATFGGSASFKTWFFRIVYNTAVSKLRTRKLNEVSFEDVKISDREVADTENAMSAMNQSDRIRYLNMGLSKLEPEDRAMLHMYYFENFTVEEIASVTALSHSNVKVKLFRVRKKLFEYLQLMLKDEVISII